MQFSCEAPETTGELLLSALFQVGRMMRRAGGGSADPHTYRLLHQLHRRGTVRMTDLAEILELDASTVSRQLQQLDKSGLVQRSRHPDDGRAQAVAITAAGESLLEQGKDEWMKFVNARTADWSRADLDIFTRLLSTFAGSEPTDDSSSSSTTPLSTPSSDSARTDSGRVPELEHA